MKVNWKKLAAAVALPLVVGGLSALLTRDSMIVFEYVKKPPLSPPQWLFPIAWTLLYIMMGLASYFVCVSRRPKLQRKSALELYIIQLAFNFLWSIIFFNLEEYLFAFIWLCVLWLLILLTTIRFFAADKKAGYLMIPYLLWVAFAGYLNRGIYLLN